MSALYEGVKWFRVYLQMASDKADAQNRAARTNESSKGLLEVGCPNGAVYSPTTTASVKNSSRFRFADFQRF